MGRQKKDKAAASVPIGDEVESFVRNVNSLSTLMPRLMAMVSMAALGSDERFADFAKQYGEVVEASETSASVKFQTPYITKATRLKRQLDEVELGKKLVPRTFVVALVSQLDGFLGRLLRRIFLLRPELMNSSERHLSFAQLMELGTIEAARDHLLEKEIETVLRKSHTDQFNWMESRFGLTLTKGLEIWPTFIELTERRNLFVHADGVVSDQYLAVCRASGVPLGDLKKGDVLEVAPGYFDKATSCVFEIGIKLSQVLWRKLFPNDLNQADEALINASYDLLVRGKYALAAELLDFGACTLKKHGSEQNRRILTVNRAQAYKWRNDDRKCLEILRTEDWSASSASFQLCVAVLRDNFEEAASIMRRLGQEGEVPEAAYEDWPVFRRFRASTEFLEAYSHVFGRPFVHLEKILIDRDAELTRARIKRLQAMAELGPDRDDDKVSN